MSHDWICSLKLQTPKWKLNYGWKQFPRGKTRKLNYRSLKTHFVNIFISWSREKLSDDKLQLTWLFHNLPTELSFSSATYTQHRNVSSWRALSCRSEDSHLKHSDCWKNFHEWVRKGRRIVIPWVSPALSSDLAFPSQFVTKLFSFHVTSHHKTQKQLCANVLLIKKFFSSFSASSLHQTLIWAAFVWSNRST